MKIFCCFGFHGNIVSQVSEKYVGIDLILNHVFWPEFAQTQHFPRLCVVAKICPYFVSPDNYFLIFLPEPKNCHQCKSLDLYLTIILIHLSKWGGLRKIFSDAGGTAGFECKGGFKYKVFDSCVVYTATG